MKSIVPVRNSSPDKSGVFFRLNDKSSDSIRRLTQHINLVIQRYSDNEDVLLKLEMILEASAKDCAQYLWDIDTHRGENEEYSDDEIEF